MASDCLFCGIVAGEVPAQIVDSDEHTVAFMDINPATRGHALVVPRAHSADLFEISDSDLERTMLAARRLAGRMRAALEPDGFNVLNAVRAGGLADDLPLPPARHPALRRRSAEAALDTARRRGRGDRRAGRSDQGGEPDERPRFDWSATAASPSMVLHDPPLNLFGAAAFEALNECLDEVEGSDARALVWRAEGEVFTGGADVNVFQQIVDAGGDRSDLSFEPLLGAVRRLEALPHPDARPRPRPLPHGRARGLARLRHDLGRRVRALRPGRGGGRASPLAPAAPSGWPSERGPPEPGSS